MAILKSVVIICTALVLILAMSYWAAGRAKPVLDEAERAALLKKRLAFSFVQLSDGVTHYRLEGPADGPLIVLIHGFAAPSFVFDDYFPLLTAAGYRVLCFDLYGRGFSSRPHLPYDAALFDRQISGLLDALNLHAPAHLVGYSLGGAAATIFATRHPERVASLSLIAPAGLRIKLDAQTRFLMRPIVGDWLVRMFGQRIFHDVAAQVARTAPNPASFLTKFDRQMDYANYGDALLSTLRLYPLSNSEADFRKAGHDPRPVLVIWGEADEVVPFADAQHLLALMPQAKLHSYPSLGHDIAYARAPLIASLLIDFLKETTTKRSDAAGKEAAGKQPPR